MKKFLTILFSLFVIIGCDKSEKPKITINSSETPSAIELSNITGTTRLTISSNVDWVASLSNPSAGFTFSPKEGLAGTTVDIIINVTPNRTKNARSSDLVITAKKGGASTAISITQPSMEFSLDSYTLLFANSNDTKNIKVSSNVDWEVDKTSLPEWIASVTPEKGSGNSPISFVSKENKERKERQATIKIAYCGKSSYASVLLKQEAALNNPPTKPIITNPVDGAVDVSTAPLVKWNASTDADNDAITYQVKYSLDKEKWSTLDAGEETQLDFELKGKYLTEKTKYYLKVVADDGYDKGVVESDVIQFTTSEKKIYLDGDYKIYQESKKSKPIKLVFTGDGYLAADYVYGGKFDKDINTAIEALFSTEPYKSYREYFTVYKLAAYSKEKGISSKVEGQEKSVNTKFKSTLTGGTGIECNHDVVFDFVLKNLQEVGFTESDLYNTSIALIIDVNQYAGTCISFNNGKSIGMVPRHVDDYTFGKILLHEYGGHGFGRLADEYVNYNEQIPEENKERLASWQGWGYSLNVTTKTSYQDAPWARFKGVSGYSAVGMYAGAYYYQSGVYKPESISCMVDNRRYFNAQSRYLIVERIFQVAGEEFSFELFKSKDVQKTDPTTKAGIEPGFVPLGAPIYKVAK